MLASAVAYTPFNDCGKLAAGELIDGCCTARSKNDCRVEVLEDRTDENFGHCTAVHGQLHSRISQLEKGHKEHTERFSLFDFRLQQCEGQPGPFGLAADMDVEPAAAPQQPQLQFQQPAPAAAPQAAPAVAAVPLPSKQQAMDCILQHSLLRQEQGQAAVQVAKPLLRPPGCAA